MKWNLKLKIWKSEIPEIGWGARTLLNPCSRGDFQRPHAFGGLRKTPADCFGSEMAFFKLSRILGPQRNGHHKPKNRRNNPEERD